MAFGTDHTISGGFAPEGDADRDPLVGLREFIDRLADQDVADMVDDRLAQDVVLLCRLSDRLEAVTAGRFLAAQRRGVGIADGHPSTAAWLAWQTGRSRGDVNRTVRVAQTAELLEATGQAWRDGSITSAAMRSIDHARVPGHDQQLVECEPEFLAFARRRDHRSLETVTRHFRKCALADGSAPDAPDGLTLAPVGDRTVLRGEFASDSAETITHALAQFTAKPSPNDGATAGQRRAGAFVRICEIALGRGQDGEPARPAVSYVTHATDREPGATPPLTLGQFTGVIDPRDRERIICDATITEITVDADSTVLDVGRATRVWPVAMRKAIVVRDGTCRWPGCEVPAGWCDVHHHQSWEHGGRTALGNGMLLCRAHHTFLHQRRDWHTTFDDQNFRAFRPDGRELLPDPWAEPPPDHPPRPPGSLTRAA